MTQLDPWGNNYASTRDAELKQDGQAIADPTCHSANEVALGELLTDILGYKPNRPAQHARWLLTECRNDYDNLRRLIVRLRIEGKLDWLRLQRRNVYSLRAYLAEEWARERQDQERREYQNTTEGRKARYLYPGVEW